MTITPEKIPRTDTDSAKTQIIVCIISGDHNLKMIPLIFHDTLSPIDARIAAHLIASIGL